MPIIMNKTEQCVEFLNTATGKLCGTYHYEDEFKSFFRGLYTPDGKDVVAYPQQGHLHHKGLQFGLTTDLANFWEENKADEPKDDQLPIGKQHNARLDCLPPDDGIGFIQQIDWLIGTVCVFNEKRMITVVEAEGAYVWSWAATLTAALPSVQIIKSVWDAPSSYCSPQYGYCGLGLRLARDLFSDGKVLVVPAETKCGESPTGISFQGGGAEVTFNQNASQGDVLFVTTYQNVPPYGGGPGFAFMGLVPTPRTLEQHDGLELWYTITVSDV